MDDLVNRLRNYCDGNNDLMDTAADMIEKQQEYIEAYQDQTNILLTRIDQLEKALENKDGKLE